MREIVSVHVGQAGCQLGNAVIKIFQSPPFLTVKYVLTWGVGTLLCRTRHQSWWNNWRRFRVYPIHVHVKISYPFVNIKWQFIFVLRFFSEANGGKYVPRSLYIVSGKFCVSLFFLSPQLTFGCVIFSGFGADSSWRSNTGTFFVTFL